MPTLSIRAAVATLLLLAAAGPAPGQDAPPAEPAAALVVRAMLPDDSPIVGARVDARRLPQALRETWGRAAEDPDLVASATTDANGAARLTAAAFATWRIEVHAAGRATVLRNVDVDPSAPRSLDVRLAAGCALEGLVTEDGTTPVADVTVVAGPVGFEGDRARVLASATTDAAGRYRLDGLPRGGIDLFARCAGTGMRWFGRLTVPNFERRDLRFPRGGTLTGVVRDGDTGAIVAGARIRVAPFGASWAAEGVSDAQGRYEIRTRADSLSVHDIVVEAPGQRLERGDDIPPRQGLEIGDGQTVRRDLTLRPAPRVVGTVTADGRPVGGAAVTLRARRDAFDSEGTTRHTTTDEAGAYAFDSLEPGTASVRVEVSGFLTAGGATQHRLRFFDEDASEAGRATIPERGDVRVDIALVKAATRRVSGRVIGAGKRSVPGATVRCGNVATTTAADGTFHVDAPAKGESLLHAVATGYAEEQRSAPPAGGPGAGDIEIVLHPLPQVRVRVLDTDGKPVAGATVTIGSSWGESDGMRVWPPPPRPASDVTGPDGIAVLLWAAETSDLVVSAVAPGFARRQNALDIGTQDEVTTDLTLPRSRSVRVKVVAETTKAPIAGAWLTLGADEEPGTPTVSAVPRSQQRGDVHVGRTGADGTVVLPDLGPEPVRVHATASRHHAAEARVTADAKDVEVTLVPWLRVAGRVEWEDGRPAAGITISVYWIDHPEGWPCVRGPFGIGDDGLFVCDALAKGRYQVDVMTTDRAGGPSVAPMSSEPFAAGTEGIVVRVRPGRRIAGVVVGPEGKGVAKAEIEVRPPGDSNAFIMGETVCGDDGTFVSAHSPHGPVVLRVDAKNCGEGGRERRVVVHGPFDPKDEVVRVVLEPGLTIEGVLLGENGKPLARQTLGAIRADAKEPSIWEPCNGCRTDAEGRFRIGGLAAGTYRIWPVDDWANVSHFSSGRSGRPTPLDPDTGTPAGTKGLTLKQ